MPSHDNLLSGLEPDPRDMRPEVPVRPIIEWVLRVIALVVLALLLWQAVHALRVRPIGWARGGSVRTSLAAWSTTETPSTAHVVLDSVPTPDLRDWIAALPSAGTQTSWEGAALKPSAVVVEPVVDPQQPTRIWVAAPSGSSVLVRDALSALDSINVRTGGVVLTVPHLEGNVRAIVGGTTASAALKDSLTIKPILIVGTASWEGKFIMASLEEHGWHVDAHFTLSPKTAGIVMQGPSELQIDTAHYAAVIVLDSTASKYAGAITDYVHKGGGFIATGDAAHLASFSSLMPGNASAPLPDAVFQTDTTHPRAAFTLSPLGNLKPDAVPVESRGKQVAVAARRIGTGRVLQVGYNDTWRWRMGGLEHDPVQDFRQWWSAMVSSVAYAPRTPRVVSTTAVEPTPLASLVSILGPAVSQAKPRVNPLDDPRLIPILFGVLMGAFLLEWASRRLRGRA